MNPTLKSLALVGAGMLAAGAGLWVWQEYLSRDAQIAALHRACLDEFATFRDKMKSGLGPRSESAFLKGLADGLGKALEDMSGSVGDAVCDAVRDACRSDFDGRICTVARERYP